MESKNDFIIPSTTVKVKQFNTQELHSQIAHCKIYCITHIIYSTVLTDIWTEFVHDLDTLKQKRIFRWYLKPLMKAEIERTFYQ